MFSGVFQRNVFQQNVFQTFVSRELHYMRATVTVILAEGKATMTLGKGQASALLAAGKCRLFK